jgi:hypothetical protein
MKKIFPFLFIPCLFFFIFIGLNNLSSKRIAFFISETESSNIETEDYGFECDLDPDKLRLNYFIIFKFINLKVFNEISNSFGYFFSLDSLSFNLHSPVFITSDLPPPSLIKF